MLTTNSPAVSALCCECLRGLLANITNGGFAPTRLKKLYGARFTVPFGPIVESQPIGRGTTSDVTGSCARPCGSLRGSYSMAHPWQLLSHRPGKAAGAPDVDHALGERPCV